ncbi:hypothetical protein SAMN04515672_4117 [Natronorubrum texcoconense]|uniref:Uncharacterized protein n=1 Tax=Natronorubrum texcoconense TaxID=1095776 RepID=A0A1G9F7Q9_9EURY|nr:hypothetical protein SAMN04515672_4117 [Natronorubrum texcoconense]
MYPYTELAVMNHTILTVLERIGTGNGHGYPHGRSFEPTFRLQIEDRSNTG